MDADERLAEQLQRVLLSEGNTVVPGSFNGEWQEVAPTAGSPVGKKNSRKKSGEKKAGNGKQNVPAVAGAFSVLEVEEVAADSQIEDEKMIKLDENRGVEVDGVYMAAPYWQAGVGPRGGAWFCDLKTISGAVFPTNLNDVVHRVRKHGPDEPPELYSSEREDVVKHWRAKRKEEKKNRGKAPGPPSNGTGPTPAPATSPNPSATPPPTPARNPAPMPAAVPARTPASAPASVPAQPPGVTSTSQPPTIADKAHSSKPLQPQSTNGASDNQNDWWEVDSWRMYYPYWESGEGPKGGDWWVILQRPSGHQTAVRVGLAVHHARPLGKKQKPQLVSADREEIIKHHRHMVKQQKEAENGKRKKVKKKKGGAGSERGSEEVGERGSEEAPEDPKPAPANGTELAASVVGAPDRAAPVASSGNSVLQHGPTSAFQAWIAPSSGSDEPSAGRKGYRPVAQFGSSTQASRGHVLSEAAALHAAPPAPAPTGPHPPNHLAAPGMHSAPTSSIAIPAKSMPASSAAHPSTGSAPNTANGLSPSPSNGLPPSHPGNAPGQAPLTAPHAQQATRSVPIALSQLLPPNPFVAPGFHGAEPGGALPPAGASPSAPMAFHLPPGVPMPMPGNGAPHMHPSLPMPMAHPQHPQQAPAPPQHITEGFTLPDADDFGALFGGAVPVDSAFGAPPQPPGPNGNPYRPSMGPGMQPALARSSSAGLPAQPAPLARTGSGGKAMPPPGFGGPNGAPGSAAAGPTQIDYLQAQIFAMQAAQKEKDAQLEALQKQVAAGMAGIPPKAPGNQRPPGFVPSPAAPLAAGQKEAYRPPHRRN